MLTQQSPTIDEAMALAAVPLFFELSGTELQKVAGCCRLFKAQQNQQIFDSESDMNEVFFVIQGQVRIVKFSLYGREVIFEDIGPGHYFGELAAIDGEPRSAGAVALSDVLLIRLDGNEFIRVVTSHAAMAKVLMQRLAKMVRLADKRIMDLSTLGVNNRVYAEVLRLSTTCTREDGTAVIRPLPLHGDIASRVSTTRETVARALSILTRSGLVRRSRGSLVVLDVKRLTHMVYSFKGE